MKQAFDISGTAVFAIVLAYPILLLSNSSSGAIPRRLHLPVEFESNMACKKVQDFDIRKRKFELSITTGKSEFSVGEKIPVKAKFKNNSDSAVLFEEIGVVAFYLSKFETEKRAVAVGSEVYVGLFGFEKEGVPSKGTQIQPDEASEFEVDLASIEWDDFLSSFRSGDSIRKLPAGRYYLSMEIQFAEPVNSSTGIRKFRTFASNETLIELKAE